MHALADVGMGALLGLAFNPVTALAGAALGGALGSRGRIAWAFAAVLGAWMLGDGARVVAVAVSAIQDAAGEAVAAVLAPLVVWGLVGLAVGYALPAWAGAYVGSRVTHGTGWLTGAAIAGAASAAVASLGGLLGPLR